jgi:trimeric autotransporter adhesin
LLTVLQVVLLALAAMA